MTLAEAQKALHSGETKQAVALMKEIDQQLGIEAELTSGINESPDGVNVVIVHDIKTPVDSDTLRYLAAVKGKALLDESPDKWEKQKPTVITPKSSPIRRGIIQIVHKAPRKGHGLIMPRVRSKK